MPNTNINRPTDTSNSTRKLLGGQEFKFEVILNNHELEPLPLQPGAIVEMVIEDNLLDWPYCGYLVYNNLWDGFERIKNPATNKQFYYYRMDARDEITIRVKPLIDDAFGTNKLPDKIWSMEYNFVVYDTEDIDANNNADKAKKLYFWDKRYQMLLDKKDQWSTCLDNKIRKPLSLLTDKERSLKSGDAIKSLLKKAGLENEITQSVNDWDLGINDIFYTLPANYSFANGLDYLISRHVSDDGDPCIFNIDRQTNKFQLKPLRLFFEKAGINNPGELQLEHLFFESIQDNKNSTTPFKAPVLNEPSFEIDIKAAEWNKIQSYQFVDMSGIDNSKALISKPVYWYNNKQKQFGVDCVDNEITKVKKDFTDLYVKNLYPQGKGDPIFYLNKTKKEQYNIEPKYVHMNIGNFSNKDSRLKTGKGDILFSGVFLNECISMRLLGSTHRMTGTFVGIDCLYGDDNEYDKKLCGQWFVTKVRHIWWKNKYVNDITAIKIHTYDKVNINEDVV